MLLLHLQGICSKLPPFSAETLDFSASEQQNQQQRAAAKRHPFSQLARLDEWPSAKRLAREQKEIRIK
jgi:hypothetical protein